MGAGVTGAAVDGGGGEGVGGGPLTLGGALVAD